MDILLMKRYFPEWETVKVDTFEFKNYLQQKQDIDFEGIWDYGKFKIGIKRDSNNYIGFIIESKTDTWTKGQVKFKIFPESATYYTDNHTTRNEYFILIGKNIVHLENQNDGMLRLFPRYEDKYSQSVMNNQPYCEKVNTNTVYLRIPSFAYQFNNTINSLVSANKELITKNENLIIDLRFNSGGLDNCWQSIMPFISSNPVFAKNCYFLSTKLNNKQAKQFLNESRLKKLNNNLGKFVLLSDEEYTTVDYGKFEYPQKVAILVNHTCASSTEQFLLYAQQSKKVKIFGTNTMGSLDFSNVNTVESPCKEFLLYYATSKAVDIDKHPIDGIGIQPDYNLNDIPDYKWVDYVTKILNNDSE
jgi:hypothetical protein